MSNVPDVSSVPGEVPGPRKRTRLLIVAGVLAGLSLAVGVPYWWWARQYESTDDAAVEGHVIPVAPKIAGQVVEVLVKDNELVKEGQVLVKIDPRDATVRQQLAEAALTSAQARAQAAKVYVELTKMTSQADLDAATAGVAIAKDAVSSAAAGVDVATSKVLQADARVGSAKAFVEQANAQIAADQAEADRTAADLKRYSQLKATGSITNQQFDAATAASQAAAAHLAAARKAVASAEAQRVEAEAAARAAQDGVKQAQAALAQANSGVLQAQAKLAMASVTAQRVAQAEAQQQGADADVVLAEATLRQAKDQMAYTTVVAPQAGRVARKGVQVGSYVQIGQAMLAVVPLEVWVVANFKETQLTNMKPGQDVTVTVDAYPGQSFKARLESLQAGTGARFSLLPPENATGNFVKVVQRVPVKIVFEAEAPGKAPWNRFLLAPGMSVVPEVKVR
ncbi:MAG: HlyD family secretion protein [Planctomycetota bacterium]|nr:HlyD family secretion protein [Planctomycetota bacterium]